MPFASDSLNTFCETKPEPWRANQVKEFETAMDEMEIEHKHQLDILTKDTTEKFNAYEKKTFAENAELTKVIPSST